jgi:hypothetical protein
MVKAHNISQNMLLSFYLYILTLFEVVQRMVFWESIVSSLKLVFEGLGHENAETDTLHTAL